MQNWNQIPDLQVLPWRVVNRILKYAPKSIAVILYQLFPKIFFSITYCPYLSPSRLLHHVSRTTHQWPTQRLD